MGFLETRFSFFLGKIKRILCWLAFFVFSSFVGGFYLWGGASGFLGVACNSCVLLFGQMWVAPPKGGLCRFFRGVGAFSNDTINRKRTLKSPFFLHCLKFLKFSGGCGRAGGSIAAPKQKNLRGGPIFLKSPYREKEGGGGKLFFSSKFFLKRGTDLSEPPFFAGNLCLAGRVLINGGGTD